MVAVAAIICVIATAACGTDTTAAFKQGYASARGPLNQTLTEIMATITHPRGQTPAQILTQTTVRIGALATRLDSQLGSLTSLRPPARVATQFATLTSSMRRVGKDLRGAYAGFHAGNQAVATLALESLQADAGDASSAGLAVAAALAQR